MEVNVMELMEKEREGEGGESGYRVEGRCGDY